MIMEKILTPYEKQYMRVAILKHEETFKRQVYELHRLYQVQKMLMKNMETKQELRRQDNIVKTGIGFIRAVGEDDAELCDVFRGDLRRLDLDNMGGSDVENIDESEIELTLGPACYGRPRKKKSSGDSDSGRRSLSSSTSTGSSDNRGNNERLMRPQPWLQIMSLNVTR
ncbi:PREDICTED: uncharacterized protein LOC104819252 [Tarenaya hassleriana]|uniref:uncharacterized protein LOC104819252 n=1 Tax=Tarenaya hassleriana TaxID=28532 RepID=UPI00053C41E1|nr:PREDICTED: uncharacterized protein LOC104819252 [Tarenaya hassleriana]